MQSLLQTLESWWWLASPDTGGTPPDLAADVIDETVQLSWTDIITDNTGYSMQRAVGSGAFSELATVGPDENSFVDLGPFTANQNYRYRLTVLGGVLDSTTSNVASETPVIDLGALLIVKDLPTLKRGIGADEVDASQDQYLTELEAAASTWLENELHMRFQDPASRTEYIEGSGMRQLYVSGYIDDGTSDVTIQDQPLLYGTSNWSDIDAADFEVRNHRAIVRTDGWPWQRNTEYKVTYDDGYNVAPLDIQAVVMELVAAAMNDADAEAGITSEHIGDYSYSINSAIASAASGLTDMAWRTINHYRRLRA